MNSTERPLHVLLAEDNPGDVLLVDEALKEHGLEYTLFLADDGEKVVEYMDKLGKAPEFSCPDVFLLDLNLPKAQGHEVLRMFRSRPECEYVPVIIMTSSDSPKDHEMAAALGACYCFRKPSSLDEFIELGQIVKNCLTTNKSMFRP